MKVRLSMRSMCGALMLLLLAGLAVGCAGSGSGDLQPGNLDQAPALALLPALPVDAIPAHQTLATQSELQLGDQAFAKSAGAMLAPPLILLPAAVGELEWAYWRFNVGEVALGDVQVHFSVTAGTQAWLGISSYGAGVWELSGPFLATQDVMLNDGDDYISPAGNLYVLVAAYNDNTASVQELFLTYDDGVTTYSISGGVFDGNGLPIPASSVTVNPGNINVNCSTGGTYTVPGLSSGAYTVTPNAAGYVFVPAFSNVPLLNADVSGVDFIGTAQAMVTYVDDARPFLMANCAGCHDADKPLLGGFTVEWYDSALSRLADIGAMVEGDHNGSYTVAEKAMIAEWVAGGGVLGANATHYTDVRAQIFQPICMNCHDSGKTGAERNEAPDDVNWDTYATATAWRTNNKFVAKRGNTRAQAGEMPPTGELPPNLKQLWQDWTDSGWPN